MTRKSHCTHSFVNWARTINLLLSTFVVILSLYTYHCSSLPISALLEEGLSRYSSSSSSSIVKSAVTATGDQAGIMLDKASMKSRLLLDMIYGRKLIASLVAAQASIFCPLLLMVTREKKKTSSKGSNGKILSVDGFLLTQRHNCVNHIDLESYETAATAIGRHNYWHYVCEQACQFLMPLGLAVCWIFSVLYDRRTDQILFSRISNSIGETDLNTNNVGYYQGLHGQIGSDSVLYALKYSIITTLVLEMWTIGFTAGRLSISAWLKDTNFEKQRNQGAIQLP